jgi:antitoxin component of MazEF toxin-antitoxin module
METAIKAWGNSFAIRLGKRDLDRLGLKPGETVEVTLRPLRRSIDLSGLPTVRGRKGETVEDVRKAMYLSRQRWEE